MRLITVTDDTGTQVQREVTRDELATLSGPQLAALMFPAPTVEEIASVSGFLRRYRTGAR
jgi:C4-type Zn-finger protein